MLKNLRESLGINRAVSALAFARLGDAIGNSILIVIIPLYVAKLPTPLLAIPQTIRVGLLIATFGLAAAILQPIMGAVSDRLSQRKLLIMVGLLLMGGATATFMAAVNFTDLLILRLFQGIGAAITIPASMALLADVTDRKTRGSSMGFFSMMRMVGFAIGPLLGGFLQQYFSFDLAFIVGSAFTLVGLFLVYIWVQDPEPEPGAEDKPRKPFQLFDRSLLSAGLLGTSFATLVMASDFAMLSSLENQVNQRLNQAALGFGIAFSSLIIARLIFQLPLGNLSDRIGRKPVLISGLLLMAPATAFLGYAATTWQLASLRVLQGLASAAIAAPALALAADLSSSGGQGRQMSLVTTGFGLGIAVGPLLSGFLAVYSYVLPFFIGAGMALLAAYVIFQFVPETVEKGAHNSEQENKKENETYQPERRRSAHQPAAGDD